MKRKRLLGVILLVCTTAAIAFAGEGFLGIVTKDSWLNPSIIYRDTLRGWFLQIDSVQLYVAYGNASAGGYAYEARTGANPVSSTWIDSSKYGGNPRYKLLLKVDDIDGDSGVGLYTMSAIAFGQGGKTWENEFTFFKTDSSFARAVTLIDQHVDANISLIKSLPFDTFTVTAVAVNQRTQFVTDRLTLTDNRDYARRVIVFTKLGGTAVAGIPRLLARFVNNASSDTVEIGDSVSANIAVNDQGRIYSLPWEMFTPLDAAASTIALQVMGQDTANAAWNGNAAKFGYWLASRVASGGGGSDTLAIKAMMMRNYFLRFGPGYADSSKVAARVDSLFDLVKWTFFLLADSTLDTATIATKVDLAPLKWLAEYMGIPCDTSLQVLFPNTGVAPKDSVQVFCWSGGAYSYRRTIYFKHSNVNSVVDTAGTHR